MSGNGADSKKNRIAKLKIIVDSPLKVSDFTYDIEYRTYRYVKRSGEVVPSKLMKIHDAKFPTQNGNLAFSYPYNLLTYYDYIKILDDQPISRSGRVKFVVYQNNNGHKIKIKELPIDWYYQSENNPFTLKIHVTGSPNGEPDNTHTTAHLGKETKAILFFVGGAGDKYKFGGLGPNYNIIYARNVYLQRKSKEFEDNKKIRILDKGNNDNDPYYLSYREIYKDIDIKKVIATIPDKSTLVYIIGHSLGGWNGANLTTAISNAGYKVKMFISLDPVGTDPGLARISDIFLNEPKVTAEIWINIRCEPGITHYSFSDMVATAGGQWIPKQKPTYDVISKANHLDAEVILESKVNGNLTALDLLIESLKANIK